MKSVLLLLSVFCLAFTFTQQYDGGTSTSSAPEPAAAASPSTEPATSNKAATVTDVVTAANAFKALLTTAQQGTLQQTYTSTLAHKWSNLPCGSSCRNGIQFSTLTSAQLDAAKTVIAAAAGTAANEGYDEFIQITLADSILGATSGGGGGYSKGIYFISFLNAPTATGAWMLQFGGHHYAANIAFNNGRITGVTPRFEGVEPKSFTAANGSTYAPIDQEHTAIVNMLAGLSSTELASAKLTGSFSDVVLGPNQDGNFPVTKAGVKVSTLSTAVQTLVLNAMKPWVNDADTATARVLLAIYQAELANTYIGWGGTSAAMTNNGDYARIDGPSVWIEFVCQSGVVFQNQIHYHTVHRDHTRDYGSNLTGSPIDTTTTGGGGVGVAGVRSMATVSVYPNPAGDYINIAVPERLKAAIVSVINMANGQTVLKNSNYSGTGIGLDIARLPSGNYFVRIDDGSNSYSGRFTKR